MVKCKDICQMNLDGVTLIAGESGLERVVSWTYVVMTRPFEEHMNRGDFALGVIDFQKVDFAEAMRIMRELNELSISGIAFSIVEERQEIPECMMRLADELALPLFRIRWDNASFVDITQSIGNYIVATNTRYNAKGDFLYNLLFGYDVNERYISKMSQQFDLTFDQAYRVGVIVVDRSYGENLEQDEHNYQYYMNAMTKRMSDLSENVLFMHFLNKGVILFPSGEDKQMISVIEKNLIELDTQIQFQGKIRSTCILGRSYLEPVDFVKSYQEAKSLIPKKDLLPNSKDKKVISSTMLGIYKYLFENPNQEEIKNYCNGKLRKLEEYDHANHTNMIETVLTYYMNGFNLCKTASALYVHRNTLQYRLAKISELLEMEMDDYFEYLELLNCIILKKVLFT